MTRNLASTSSGSNGKDLPQDKAFAWGKSDGSSLENHIRACLNIYLSLKSRIPLLPRAAQTENFWTLLFWAVFFHDFGKLHPEFQKVLKNENDNLWHFQRHELYSLPFACLAANLSTPDNILICQAILAHHKDFKALAEKHKPQDMLEFEMDMDRRYLGLDHHPEDFPRGIEQITDASLFRPFMDRAAALAQEFGFNWNFDSESGILHSCPHPFEAIAGAYRPPPRETPLYWQQILLWGALKICDHYGSARVKKLYRLKENHFAFLDRLKAEYGNLYSHQETCGTTQGNIILVAPTGSGKTEAAMAWLKTQLKDSPGRAYYILPYTASINAMHLRLTEDMGIGETPIVGIQHGKLMDYLYTCMEGEECVDFHALETLADQYRKIICPLKIATPFQLLKYAYGVKGFEMGFAHLSGAKLIFDEIHAYDARTFAQLLIFLNYLVIHFACKVMIMTATLPGFMLEALKNSLGVKSEIRADKAFLMRSPRHRVVLLKGGIWDHMDKIKTALENPYKKILVVCNTVFQAQEIFEELSFQLEPEERVLLHSRFTSLDRQRQEKRIFNDKTRLVVGTQAIEVSLDIDFHIMFTEPAPMDRLLQRFGRINRRYGHSPCPVHVFTQGGENDHWIYPLNLVDATLSCLSHVDLINENRVQEMMDEVYQTDWPEKEKKEYETTTALFKNAITSLSPFTRHREEEKTFYEQFTGVQVLPARLFSEYRAQILERNFIRADQLLVGLQQSGFRKLLANDQIRFVQIPISTAEDKIRAYQIPVAQCRYDEDLGMTNEFEALYDPENIHG